jgi:hypothetical protein
MKKKFTSTIEFISTYEIEADDWREALKILKAKDFSKMTLIGQKECVSDFVDEKET